MQYNNSSADGQKILSRRGNGCALMRAAYKDTDLRMFMHYKNF
jgi:hypothetical protein